MQTGNQVVNRIIVKRRKVHYISYFERDEYGMMKNIVFTTNESKFANSRLIFSNAPKRNEIPS